jgi:hypothetical protein
VAVKSILEHAKAVGESPAPKRAAFVTFVTIAVDPGYLGKGL